MLRRITLIIVVLLLLHTAVSAATGWLLRRQIQQQINLAPATSLLQQRLQAGVFNTEITLATAPTAPLAMRFHGGLQHGPLLRRPWQPGWLRLRGGMQLQQTGSDGENDHAGQSNDLEIDLYSNLRGQVSSTFLLPEQLDLRSAAASTSGALQGRLQLTLAAADLHAALKHPAGLLCLADNTVDWQDLKIELRLADYRNWLHDGLAKLRADRLGWRLGASCIQRADHATAKAHRSAQPAVGSMLQAAHVQLRWPASASPVLSLQAQNWHGGGQSIGPVNIELELHQLERAAASQWLQALYAYQAQPEPGTLAQLNLAAQTTALLQQRPQLLLRQVQVAAAKGTFVLHGEIELRPGGMRAHVHGETTSEAIETMLTVLLQDQTQAMATLRQWRRLGIVQDIDGRLLIDVVVNQ